MKRLWGSLTILAMAGALVTVQGTAAMAQPDPNVLIPISQATQTPVPIAMAVGQPVVVRLEGRTPTTVATTPPEIVHVILRGDEILLIPLREGQTMLSIGVGDGAIANLALAVGTADGVRLITLGGSTAAVPTAPSSGANIETFVGGLSGFQRHALIAYLQMPSLSTLSVLVQSLDPSQQQALVDVLANRDALTGRLLQGQPAAAGATTTAAPTPMAASSPAVPPVHTVGPVVPPAPSAPRPQPEAGVTVNAPAGITVHVTPTNTQGVLYLSYVLQNGTGNVIQADPHEIEVAGARGPVTVRQMDIGTPSEIASGSMETGIIALVPDGGEVKVTWRLRDDSGNALSVGVVIATK